MPRMGKKKRAARKKAGRKLREAASHVANAYGEFGGRAAAGGRSTMYLRHAKARYAAARTAYRTAGGRKGRKSAAKSARRKAGRGI